MQIEIFENVILLLQVLVLTIYKKQVMIINIKLGIQYLICQILCKEYKNLYKI